MMKYIYTLVITFAVWNTVVAQEGVRFRDLAFNEALAQAKAEDKLVFMDCYTSWWQKRFSRKKQQVIFSTLVSFA